MNHGREKMISDTGTLKKTPITEIMVIGCKIPCFPKPERGIHIPYGESKPIWRLLYDREYKNT
jgi:hypothetical protein